MSSAEKMCSSPGRVADGLSGSLSLMADIFITRCAVMEEKGGWSLARTEKSWWMGMTLSDQPFINSTDANGTI